MESRTEDDSDVVLQVGKIYSDLYGRDMVEVMKGAKKIEVQLISNIQKDNILAACKELADCYKSVKNALKSLETPEPLATDYIVALLTKFQTSSASLVTTVQATSISSIAFKEFLPKIQALKNNILSLKSFFLSTKDQQLLQYKFLSKTIKLEPELHLSGQRASIHISTVRKEDERGMVSSPNLLANRTNLVTPNSSSSSVGSNSESSDSYYSPSSTPSMSVKTTPNSSQQITETNFPNSSLSSIRSPSTPSPKVSPSTSQNSVLSPVASPIPASSPVGSPKISSPIASSPKSAERPAPKEKRGFLTLSPRRSSVTRTASQTNMAKAMKQAPKTGSPNTISVATGQMFKPPDVITCVDLFEAARKGDVTQAQLLRKKGLGINGIDSNGWSALHHAASLGYLEVAQYLVSEGIKLDIQDLSGMTAFDRACIQGKEDMALYLHRMGATFDPSSKVGKDVLRRSTVSRDFWHEILGEEFDKINLNTSTSGTLRRSSSATNSPSGTPTGTPTGTLRETRLSPNTKVTSLPVITLTEDEDPTVNNNFKPLPVPPSQPKPLPPPKILEQLSSNPQTTSTPSILSLATPNASVEMSPTGSNNTSPNSTMISKEIQFADLHPLVEQFTNELTYCIKFLCYPHFSKEELDNFSEPLRTLSLLLRDILSVAKSNPDVPFKTLHETTVRLVQNVKSLYTSRSFLKEPIIESSLNVMTAISNFYFACEGVTPQEEVLEDVQQYLFVMKQVLDPSASKDTITMACKALHVKLMALFTAGLKFANGSPMQFQKRLVNALCDLQDNAEKIVDQRFRNEIPREETKRTAALIRELIAVIKSAEATSSAFEFFTANYDNSLEVASAQIEGLIQSTTAKLLPRSIISILPPLTAITKELRRMDKVNNSLDLLEACGSIVEATQSVTDVIDAYHRGGNFKDEQSSKLVLDALFLLHRCTIQIKTVGCTEVLKKLKAYQNVLNIGSVRVLLRSLGLAVAALFDALKVNQTKDVQTPQPIAASPSNELPEEDNSQASESDQHIAKLHADAAAANLEIKALASCKLYEFRYVDPVWKPTSISGTVALLFHKPTQDLFFQITDQETQESLFLYKVQPELGYHESSEYFHRFKSEFGYIGFSFFNIDEAKIFSAATQQMHKLYMSR